MSLPVGTAERLLRQLIDNGLAQIQTALDTAVGQITSLQGVAQTADTQITDSQDDRAALHTLCDQLQALGAWYDGRLKTLEDAAGIVAPPNPLDPPPDPTPTT